MKKNNLNDPVTKGMLDGAVDAILDALEPRFKGIDRRLSHIENNKSYCNRGYNDYGSFVGGACRPCV